MDRQLVDSELSTFLFYMYLRLRWRLTARDGAWRAGLQTISRVMARWRAGEICAAVQGWARQAVGRQRGLRFNAGVQTQVEMEAPRVVDRSA